MAVIGDLLFYDRGRGLSLDDVLRHAANEGLRAAVEKLPAAAFNKSDEELAKEVAEDAQVEPLQVDFEGAIPTVRETTVDVSRSFDYGFPSGGRAPGLEATKSIPFQGDAQLWKLQPNPYDLNPPRGEVNRGHVKIGIAVPTSQASNAASYIDEQVSKIKEYVERQRKQIESHNRSLEGAAINYIRARRSSVGTASDLLKRLGG